MGHPIRTTYSIQSGIADPAENHAYWDGADSVDHLLQHPPFHRSPWFGPGTPGANRWGHARPRPIPLAGASGAKPGGHPVTLSGADRPRRQAAAARLKTNWRNLATGRVFPGSRRRNLEGGISCRDLLQFGREKRSLFDTYSWAIAEAVPWGGTATASRARSWVSQ